MSRKATPFLVPLLAVLSVETSTQKDAVEADVGNEVCIVESSRRFSEGVHVTISSALEQTDEDIDVEAEIDVKLEDHRFDAEGDLQNHQAHMAWLEVQWKVKLTPSGCNQCSKLSQFCVMAME